MNLALLSILESLKNIVYTLRLQAIIIVCVKFKDNFYFLYYKLFSTQKV